MLLHGLFLYVEFGPAAQRPAGLSLRAGRKRAGGRRRIDDTGRLAGTRIGDVLQGDAVRVHQAHHVAAGRFEEITDLAVDQVGAADRRSGKSSADNLRAAG